MKNVSIQDLLSPMPVQPKVMTKKERLEHWAELVRHFKGPLYLFHNLEYYTPLQLKSAYPGCGAISAFTLAEKDTTFQDQGLKVGSTLADHMKFFSLTQQELHEFSCDCGGHIDNRNMASRIQHVADFS
jgi:hypothetical protein